MTADTANFIIELIITLIVSVIFVCILPWIRTKIGDANFEKLIKFVNIAVRAARQLYIDVPENNQIKKEYVTGYITDKAEELGLDLTIEDIDNLIEGVYNQIKEGTSGDI